MALSEYTRINGSFLLCLPGTYSEKQAVPDCRYDERCLHRRMESGSFFGFAVYEEWGGLNQCRSIIGMIWKLQHGMQYYKFHSLTNTELINVFTGYVQTLDLFYMPSIC